ncbi:MAG TPA: hypothetical protein PKI60_06215 [Oscillospiraceae bacterium]|jgi:hypothetical protein|nr:hypothetical protein [Oscillospiraceae bacterium]
MPTEVIIALISFIGTAIGTAYGIMKSNSLTLYRIKQLENKVAAHNNLIERTYKLEELAALTDEKIRVANHRIDDLEDKG